MDQLDVLRVLFNEKSVIAKTIEHNVSYIVLNEETTNDSSVKIKNIPINSVVIKFDSNFRNDKIFQGKYGECSRCDYIIFYIDQNKLNILYVELKKAIVTAVKLSNSFQEAWFSLNIAMQLLVNSCRIVILIFLAASNILLRLLLLRVQPNGKPNISQPVFLTTNLRIFSKSHTPILRGYSSGGCYQNRI